MRCDLVRVVDHFSVLYHGTSIEAGLLIIKEGIKLPLSSRWTLNGLPIPLEHGLRFYTTPCIVTATQFAQSGMILKFIAPFPVGMVSIINPGPGGGAVQVSFGEMDVSILSNRLNEFSVNYGKTWSNIHRWRNSGDRMQFHNRIMTPE
jgi:hypothetical protein